MIIKKNLEYTQGTFYSLKYDFFHPDGNTEVPLVVLLHGGGFTSGDRSMFHGEAQWLVKHGYAAACIDYRLAPDNPFPAAIEDAQQFVAFAKENSKTLNIQPKMIFSLGNSSGGYLAMMLSVLEKGIGINASKNIANMKVTGAISFSGASNLLPTNPETSLPESTREFLDSYMQFSIEGYREVWEKASPIYHVSKQSAPIFLVHGKNDTVIPINQSRIIHKRLVEIGVQSDFLELEDESHSLTFEGWTTARNKYLQFMKDICEKQKSAYIK